jgi:hypothetical protein
MAKTMHATKRVDNIDKNKPVLTKNFTLPGVCKACQQSWNLKLKVIANAGMQVSARLDGICEAQLTHPITKKKSQCGTKVMFLLRGKMPDK